MTAARDLAEQALSLIDGTGATLVHLAVSDGSGTLRLGDCGSYRAVCAAARVTPDAGRLVGGHRDPHRIHDAIAGNLVIEHLCWPHLHCWGTPC